MRFLIGFVVSAEVAAGIAALILRGNLKEVIRDRMRDGMENYGIGILPWHTVHYVESQLFLRIQFCR